MINTNVELNDFQKKVYAEYETVKSLKTSAERIKKDREKERKGCLAIPALLFAEFVINKAVKSQRRKKSYAENEREARELLRHKEVSDKICQMIAKISRKEILTEEKFVNNLTAALYQSDLASRFVIPENALLYAMMATEVFNIGLEKFCNDKKGDK